MLFNDSRSQAIEMKIYFWKNSVTFLRFSSDSWPNKLAQTHTRTLLLFFMREKFVLSFPIGG